MKIDMEAITGKVRDELSGINSFSKPNTDFEKALIQKSKRINELENKVKHLEDKLQKLSQERDQLIEISSDLRADLNRQQRIADELMQGQNKQ